MDIKFIRDDTEQEAITQLNEILDVLSDRKHSREVYASKRFLMSLFYASRPPAEAAPIPAEHPTVIIHEPQFVKTAMAKSFSIPVSVKHRPVHKVPMPARPKGFDTLRKDIVPVPSKIKPAPGPVGLMPAPEREIIIEKTVEKTEVPEPPQRQDDDVPLPDKEEVLDFEQPFIGYEKNYPLAVFKDRNGVAIVRGSLDKTDTEMIYTLNEPSVDVKVLALAEDYLSKDLRKKPQLFEDAVFMKKYIEKAMSKYKLPYSDDYADKVKYFIGKDVFGFGKVDAFFHDPSIFAVICDGLDKPVTVKFDNNIEIKTNVVFSTPDELNSFVKGLGSKVNYDPKSGPSFEGMINGWKVECTMGFGPISSKFVIRKP
jgi:hypothetical protein